MQSHSRGPRTWETGSPGRGYDPGALDADHWAPTGRRKYSRLGVERVVAPRETLRRVEPLLGRVGVTRIAEVGRLDRAGLPNYVAVRPQRSDEGISYFNGKGVTRRQARAGAVMEAIERYSAGRYFGPACVASFAAFASEAVAVDPHALLVPMSPTYSPDLEIEWALGFDLVSSRPTYAPMECVVLAGESGDDPHVLTSSSNGLASGNTIEEALCHALCELIERDAMALDAAATGLRRSLGALLARIGMDYDPRPTREAWRIDHEGLPLRAARMLRRLRAGGLAVYLRDITTDIGIATITCSLVERRLEGWVVHAGYGCHPDARVALTRALTEAYQCRVGMIQGGREDLHRLGGDVPSDGDPREALAAGPSGPFSRVRSVEHATVGEDVGYLLGAVQAAGLGQVVVFDLTDPAIGMPVVRVVVPGLESWSVCYSHTSRAIPGARALSLVH